MKRQFRPTTSFLPINSQIQLFATILDRNEEILLPETASSLDFGGDSVSLHNHSQRQVMQQELLQRESEIDYSQCAQFTSRLPVYQLRATLCSVGMVMLELSLIALETLRLQELLPSMISVSVGVMED